MSTAPGKMLRGVALKLMPFLKSVFIYIVFLTEQPSALTAFFKCLPIISLIIFRALRGIDTWKRSAFHRRTLTGLVFSCFGDAVLVWPSNFILGMGLFAVAQVMYTSAFGFRPLKAKLGALIYALCAIIIYTLMPGLHGFLQVGVPVYTLLLGTMLWRATARVQFFEERWPWTKLCGCFGSVCFVISDTLIGFHHFYTPLPYPQISIMLTYYFAQLGIALSAMES